MCSKHYYSFLPLWDYDAHICFMQSEQFNIFSPLEGDDPWSKRYLYFPVHPKNV